MLNKKVRKHVSIMILLIVLFQLIYNIHLVYSYTVSSEEYINPILEYKQNPENVIINYNICRNINFGASEVKLSDPVIQRITLAYVLVNNYYYQMKLPDYRTELKRVVHHYFHGSRYK